MNIEVHPLRRWLDKGWSSETARAAHMGELALAYWDWAEWSEERLQAVVSRAVILTVQRVISALPGLTDAVRGQCRAAETLSDARDAARDAARAAHDARAAEAARAAAYTTYAAAYADATRPTRATARAAVFRAARGTAHAARAAEDRDAVLITACGCWLSAL